MASNLRRLATDHAALHTSPLPPNYLFPPNSSHTSDLTSLTILLAGPIGTPYSGGLFRIHLSIPPSYPSTPPSANFRTRIFHPNIDERSGSVCVDTLKRDWRPELTLRDVLVTIGCLLVCPNAESALNEEAGRLVREDWGAFERRARGMVRVWAAVPVELEGEVREARGGEEGGAINVVNDEDEESQDVVTTTRKKETSTVIMKKKKTKQPEDQPQCEPQAQPETPNEEESEEYDSSSSTKENDSPMKSTLPSPRKPTPASPSLKKRPLSVLETDIEPEYILIHDPYDNDDASNDNEQNIAANKTNNNPTQSQSQSQKNAGGPLRKSPKLSLNQSPGHLRRSDSELDMSTLFTSPIRPGTQKMQSNTIPAPVPAPGMAGWTLTPPSPFPFPSRGKTPTPTPETHAGSTLSRLAAETDEKQPHAPSSSISKPTKLQARPKSKPKPRVGLRRL